MTLSPMLRPMIRTAIVAPLLLCSLATTGLGCAKPKLDPSVAVDTTNDPSLTPLKLSVVVSEANGLRLNRVDVTVNSGKFKVRSDTDSSGMATFELPYRAGAKIDFTFSSSELNWTESVFAIPPGVSSATVHFAVDVTGRIRFSHMQF